MRPADGVETAECWELALKNDRRPSLIAFSRHTLAGFENHAGRTRLDPGAEPLGVAQEYIWHVIIQIFLWSLS